MAESGIMYPLECVVLIKVKVKVTFAFQCSNADLRIQWYTHRPAQPGHPSVSKRSDMTNVVGILQW